VGAQTSQATAARESTLGILTRSHCQQRGLVVKKARIDAKEETYIVRGRAGFWGSVVDVATEDGDKYVLIPTARFNRQLTGEFGCR
jgi:hypothetical protein